MIFKKVILFSAYPLLLLVMLFPALVNAADSTAGTVSGSPSTAGTVSSNPSTAGTVSGTLQNPLKFGNLEDVLTTVVGAIVKIGTILLTLALIWIGFLFVAARGNEEKISSAKRALVWTLIGGLILLGATGIEAVIKSTVSGITAQ